MPHETRSESLLASFADVPDPRTRACRYPWDELMLTALCGVCSGADDWVGVVDWATLKLDWLRQYLVFNNGVASHDTFSRVFSLCQIPPKSGRNRHQTARKSLLLLESA